jgi:hypothetical protein
MRGAGFHCDQCGEKVVLLDTSRNALAPRCAEVFPEGWLFVTAADGDSWDFCSWRCVGQRAVTSK